MKTFLPILAPAVLAGLLACSEESCFVRGSRVLTPSGWRPIESLVVGDEVVTFDTTAATIATRRVRQVMQRSVPRVVRMRAGEITVLGVSPEHPFWDAAAGSFRPVAALSLESRLIALLPGARAPKELAVEEVAVVHSRGPVEVWNLEVDGEHTYFVEGILVHNKSGGGPGSGGSGGDDPSATTASGGTTSGGEGGAGPGGTGGAGATGGAGGSGGA